MSPDPLPAGGVWARDYPDLACSLAAVSSGCVSWVSQCFSKPTPFRNRFRSESNQEASDGCSIKEPVVGTKSIFIAHWSQTASHSKLEVAGCDIAMWRHNCNNLKYSNMDKASTSVVFAPSRRRCILTSGLPSWYQSSWNIWVRSFKIYGKWSVQASKRTHTCAMQSRYCGARSGSPQLSACANSGYLSPIIGTGLGTWLILQEGRKRVLPLCGSRGGFMGSMKHLLWGAAFNRSAQM